MNRMTPIRWLITIISLAGMYVVFVLTALSFDRPIPQQLHSVALVLLSTGTLAVVVTLARSFVVTALDSASTRRDEVILAKLDEVLFRHTCWMEATAQPIVAVAHPEAVALGLEVLPSPSTVAAMRRLAGKVTR